MCFFAGWIALAGCRSKPAATEPATARAAVEELARCAFDEGESLLSERPQSRVEGALRRALRRDRYAFSVRAGRCAGALGPGLRARDTGARALAEAWEELLPLAQATTPDEIFLERSVRRIGVRWSAALAGR
jgi:hypothetical protein